VLAFWTESFIPFAGRFPHAWDYEGGILIGRIHQQGKRTGAGSQFGKQVEQLLR
jgi:hypothetical protein